MGALRCVDGSVLWVEPVSCRDKAGQPYEITLNLARNSVPFAAVGQRCGYQLSELAERVSAARQDPEQAAAWPDPDDRFPAPGGRPGTGQHCGAMADAATGGHDSGRSAQAAGYLPGDHEYFTLRSRDRADLPGTGELRCVLRSSAVWVGECVGVGQHAQGQHVPTGQHLQPGQHLQFLQPEVPGQAGPRTWRHPGGAHGRWQLTRRAVIEAWGGSGVGVRAVLTSAELVAFLDTVLEGPAETGTTGIVPAAGAQAGDSRPGSSRVAWQCRSGGSEEGCRMGLRGLVYRLYERRLEAALAPQAVPRHVGVMCDGNRRWARSAGLADVSSGHQAGADKIFELLEWCQETGVEVVTLWLLSTDNLTRPAAELEPLLRIIQDTVRELVAQQWHVKPVGALDLLPADTAEVLKTAAEATVGNGGLLVNVAVGYGGRREIADAVRSLLLEHATRGTTIEELAEILDVEHIAEHLYTAGQPDPDLVIRTSGEQRLGGFLLWQSAHSEFYFCDAYWPAFRRVDFLRALRSYGERHRRFGA